MLRNTQCKSFTWVCFKCVQIFDLKCLIFVSNSEFSKKLHTHTQTKHDTGPVPLMLKFEISSTDIFNAFENKCPRNTQHVVYWAGSITQYERKASRKTEIYIYSCMTVPRTELCVFCYKSTNLNFARYEFPLQRSDADLRVSRTRLPF